MPYNVLSKPVLIIDPGHGGKDPGAVSKYGHEEDWTLKISLYQYERFQELGVPVVISRTKDVDLEENDRVSTVNNSGAKYCISNHLNAGGGDRAEVIHSIYDDGKLAHRIKDQLLAAGQNAVKVYTRQGSNGKDYYYMHRRTVPIVNIVEYAFLDNEADFKHFEANWKAYAEAVIRAFCTHIDHPYKPVPILQKQNFVLDPIPVKSPQMVRLAKFYDTQNPDIIKKLKEEGYRIVELPQ